LGSSKQASAVVIDIDDSLPIVNKAIIRRPSDTKVLELGADKGAMRGISESQVIDQDGNVWPSRGLQMPAARFGAAADDASFCEYAVKKLGFVRVETRQKAAIVQLHPARVAPQAFTHLMDWLVSKELDRVLFCNCSEEGGSTLFGDKNEAFRQIASIVSSSARDGSGVGDILLRPFEANELSATDPMRQMIDVWQANSGRWNKAALIPVIRQFLSDRYIIFEHSDTGDFIFRDFGESLPRFAAAWIKEQGTGRAVQHQPDREYGWSCALAYESVLHRFSPDLQDVDAFVRWPGAGRVRRRYKRLLLPFWAKTGHAYVLSATAEDPSIDLRAAVTH
jgi:hypothetical protein